jgi:CARDB
MVARVLAALVLVAAAPAAATAAGAPAGARLLACHRSPSIDARVAVVGTSMRPIQGAGRLAVKLDLWQRTAGARWTQRTDVPGLGSWVSPSDALLGSRAGDVFKYRQAVGRLVVPAAYRFHVTFRWLDGGGIVVREASATTAACRQPDLRPDLVLRSVAATPSTRSPGLVRYAVTVGNAGRSAVVRATVTATFPNPAGPSLHSRNVRRLAPGESVLVTFTGPGCAAGAPPPTFVADPANVLEETSEANNQLAAVCPAP